MKNYSPEIAAKMAVLRNVEHGLSRHQNRQYAKTKVASILSEKAHVRALTGLAHWLHSTSCKHLKNVTNAEARAFLTSRASERKQSTISLDRQAINLHLLPENPVEFIRSSVPTDPQDRAYTCSEIDLLVECASPKLALSIQLAVNAGLRDMELTTIGSIAVLNGSPRNWTDKRFSGRENDIAFVVRGKGGLYREVRITPGIADLLLATTRPQTKRVSHRGAHLTSYFDLIAGHRFSKDFGKLSNTVLNFSCGSHGLRHAFAQSRRNSLLCVGFSMLESIQILSQELGHFHHKNTMAYLRDAEF